VVWKFVRGNRGCGVGAAAERGRVIPPDQIDDPFRFGDGARQGFLAEDTAQRAATALKGMSWRSS
jgi:hypothetical protein